MSNTQIRIVFESETTLVNSVTEAQHIADEKGLDLVQVAPNVYRIMDYKKYLFDKSKKAKKQPKQDTKEAQFNLFIARGDLQRKIRDICKWLSTGNNVRIMIKLKGRELNRPELGVDLMNRILSSVQEQGITYNASKMTVPGQEKGGRDVTIVLRPAK